MSGPHYTEEEEEQIQKNIRANWKKKKLSGRQNEDTKTTHRK